MKPDLACTNRLACEAQKAEDFLEEVSPGPISRVPIRLVEPRPKPCQRLSVDLTDFVLALIIALRGEYEVEHLFQLVRSLLGEHTY